MRHGHSALLASFIVLAALFAVRPLQAVPSQPAWLEGGEILSQLSDQTIDGR